MSMRDKLQKWDDAFDEADVSDGSGALPDGVYIATITAVDLGTSESTGDAVVIFKLKIADGKFSGKEQQRRHYLDSSDKVQWLKKDLARCGVDVSGMRLSDLPDVIDEITGVNVEIKLSTKGQYQNLWIQRRVSAPSEKTTTAKEDFPF